MASLDEDTRVAFFTSCVNQLLQQAKTGTICLSVVACGTFLLIRKVIVFSMLPSPVLQAFCVSHTVYALYLCSDVYFSFRLSSFWMAHAGASDKPHAA